MNKKGFISTTVIYSLLLMIILVVLSSFTLYRANNNILNSFIERTKDELGEISKKNYKIEFAIIEDGITTNNYKYALPESTITFEITPNNPESTVTIVCDNGSQASIIDNIVTISGINNNDTCTITFESQGEDIYE